jgi:hypothetical protein
MQRPLSPEKEMKHLRKGPNALGNDALSGTIMALKWRDAGAQWSGKPAFAEAAGPRPAFSWK